MTDNEKKLIEAGLAYAAYINKDKRFGLSDRMNALLLAGDAVQEDRTPDIQKAFSGYCAANERAQEALRMAGGLTAQCAAAKLSEANKKLIQALLSRGIVQ